MKKEKIEYLDFDDDIKRKVGRPKLADKKTKRKSLIIASLSFFAVIILLIFGYGSLFGFRNINLRGMVNTPYSGNEKVLVTDLTPINKDITLKEKTARKLYLTVLPASASDKTIMYESSDNEVAEVDSNGVVTGLKQGTAKIKATTTDGSFKTAYFNVTVIKNADGKCSFSSVDKRNDGISYDLTCSNAKIKEIQYKIGDGDYEKLLTKKLSDMIKFSENQMKKKITLKVVYYPNNSKVTKYSTRTINNISTTKKTNGSCILTIKEVKLNSAKYDITCNNATVSKIAYKIGNGSYVGIDSSSLADTILFEESDVTRVLYFNVEYSVDGSDRLKTITKSSIIGRRNSNID